MTRHYSPLRHEGPHLDTGSRSDASRQEFPCVLIDDREGSSDLMSYLPLSECGQPCRLDCGDVMFTGNGPDGPITIGIEVKTVGDLVSSIGTKRLQARQVPMMLNEYNVCWLLIIGQYQPSPVGGMLQILRRGQWIDFKLGERDPTLYALVEKTLITLGYTRLRIKNVIDYYGAARWIGLLAQWWQKPWDQHRSMRAFDQSQLISPMPGMDPDTLRRANVAAQLPGVGYERAIAAARHFPSIEHMVNASVEEWEKVPGIGKVVAKAVRRSIWQSYE